MNQQIYRRIYWRLLRAVSLKSVSWDKQFQAGVWSSGPQSLHTIQKVTELCKRGFLIEFGCGEGRLPLSLSKGSFSHYVGYDISGVAIRKATNLVRAAGLTKCHFFQCDMANWEGAKGAKLIVAEECLYYLSRRDAEIFLRRCYDSLIPGGRILVIVHSAAKHAVTLDTCRRVCRVIEEYIVGERTFLVLDGHNM